MAAVVSVNSLDHGKPLIVDWVREINPATIVDVGAGAGTYYNLLSHHLDATWTAVEIWAPFVREYNLTGRYDRVVIGDAPWVDWSLLPADLVVFGDVLEHMPYDAAVWTWHRARAHASWLIASLPVIEWPQGEVDGNPFETHVHTWSTVGVLESLPGIVAHHVEGDIGVFLAEGEHARLRA